MGIFDYVSDLYSSLTVQTVEAEEPTTNGPGEDTSGEQSRAKDTRSGGIGSAQHDRGGKVSGGASTKSSPATVNEESSEEAEANKEDAKGAKARADANADAGARGDKVGPTDRQSTGDDEEEEGAGEDGGDDGEAEDEGEEGEDEDDEEEEEEEEPEDIKPKLEEDCLKTQQCAPLKHHYDECAERVQRQQEENGKAEEDCVEEYFHMMHCATQCAAPKLFRQLR